MNQIKSVCYDMLLDILEEADKNQKAPNDMWVIVVEWDLMI